MTIFIVSGNTFNKPQPPFLIKTSQHTRNKRELPQLDRNMHENPTVHITLDGRAQEASPLRSGARQGCFILTTRI